MPVVQGELNNYSGASLGRALNGDVSFVRFNDSLCGGEPQACSVALGGEERLEDFPLNFGRDPRPRVVDGNPAAFSGVTDVDRDLAGPSHGLGRVDEQVEEDGLQKFDVTPDEHIRSGKIRLDVVEVWILEDEGDGLLEQDANW